MLMWHKRRGCGNHHPNGNVATSARIMAWTTRIRVTKDRAPHCAGTQHGKETGCGSAAPKPNWPDAICVQGVLAAATVFQLLGWDLRR
jgi:hypothetical protein